MSREFTAASTEYLTTANAPVGNSYPFTIACWFYCTSVAALRALSSIGDDSGGVPSNDPLHLLYLNQTSATLAIASYTSGEGNAAAATSSGASLNTWSHACAILTAGNDRKVYLNGGSEGTNTTDVNPSGLDSTTIGVSKRNGLIDYPYQGKIAEFALWDVALSLGELAILNLGYSPLLIRPQSLGFYVPLIRDNDEDLIGGFSLSAVATPTIADHPRIFYPGMQTIVPAAASAAGPSPGPLLQVI